MARVVVTTWGSRGDLNPFLAVARRLRDRGHDLLFAVEEHLCPSVMAAGFPVHRLSGNSQTALAPHAGQLFGSAPPLLSVRAVFTGYVLPTLSTRVAELSAVCTGADLLIASAGQLAAAFVAELTGIAWVSIPLTPTNIPSAQTAPIPVADLPKPLRPLLNRFIWKGGELLITGSVARPLDELRRVYGLPPLRYPLPIRYLSRALTAIPVSQAFLPRPTDWPHWARMTGFCFWDETEPWCAPDALSSFLAAPGPVIAISSGSMSGDLGGRFAHFYRICIAAVEAIGARALVIGAPPGALPGSLPDTAFTIPFAPFARIYPRCAAIIHHGGIGTTAQALRAGVPALVMPWGIDQFFNGDRVTRIGAGLWISRDRSTPERIARMLRALLTERRFRERAAMIAAEIAREDGIGALCDEIEALPPLRRRLFPVRITGDTLPIAAGE